MRLGYYSFDVYVRTVSKALLVEAIREYCVFINLRLWANDNNLLDAHENAQWQNAANDMGQYLSIGISAVMAGQKLFDYYNGSQYDNQAKGRTATNQSRQSLEYCSSGFSFFEYVWDQITVGLGYETTYGRHVSAHNDDLNNENSDIHPSSNQKANQGNKKKQRKKTQQAPKQGLDEDDDYYSIGLRCCGRSR